MPVVLIDILFGILLVTAGAGVAWWRGRKAVRSMIAQHRKELQSAREALTPLTEFVEGITSHLSEHYDRVEELNRDLAATELSQVDFAVGAVAALVQANEKMHAQLSTAKETLREQSCQIEQQMAEVHTDPLTRLANRRAFDREMSRRFSEYKRHGTPLSAMLIDLDHFKQTNDLCGHPVGDEVLRSVAGVLRQTMREPDLITRYGGDEFSIIMPYTTIAKARDVAERVRKAIEQAQLRFNGTDFSVTASIGVAELRSSEHPSVLIKRMDEALYQCKRRGRNNTHWHDGRIAQPFCHAPDGTESDTKPLNKGGDSRFQADEPAGKNTVAIEGIPGEHETNSPDAGSVVDAAVRTSARGGNHQNALLATLSDRISFSQALHSRLAEWKRGGPCFAVILMEIDRFEDFAREDGLEASEALWNLATVALRSAVRDMDFLASYAPSKLAILAPGCEVDEGLAVADRIHRSVANCAVHGNSGDTTFTVSLGLTEAMEGDDVVRMLQRTEAALQCAKDGGGDRSYHHNGQWPELVPSAAGAMG